MGFRWRYQCARSGHPAMARGRPGCPRQPGRSLPATGRWPAITAPERGPLRSPTDARGASFGRSERIRALAPRVGRQTALGPRSVRPLRTNPGAGAQPRRSDGPWARIRSAAPNGSGRWRRRRTFPAPSSPIRSAAPNVGVSRRWPLEADKAVRLTGESAGYAPLAGRLGQPTDHRASEVPNQPGISRWADAQLVGSVLQATAERAQRIVRGAGREGAHRVRA